MTTDRTPRLDLPFLAPGQAQKETAHNEALALLDLVVQAQVATAPLDVPPSAPTPGACWIVGNAPVGDWAGQSGRLAGWSEAGWRFAEPCDGMTVWVSDVALSARFVAGVWTMGAVHARVLLIGGKPVIGAQQAAIAAPAGGAVVDGEARAGVAAILAALRSHGLIAT